MTLDRALAGIEQELLVGYTLTFPTDIFIHESVDYVALGHVHKYQVIRPSSPIVVYAGSLERVDFGEAKEDKGFIHVKLARNHTSFEFKSIDPRPFITIDLDLVNELEPQQRIFREVERNLVPGCVLRIRYKVHQEQLAAIDPSKIRQLCQQAMTTRLQPEVIPAQGRARLPQLNESAVSSPIVAIETYLEEVAPERKEALVNLTKDLMKDLTGL
jgi:exonuclease SbcD